MRPTPRLPRAVCARAQLIPPALRRERITNVVTTKFHKSLTTTLIPPSAELGIAPGTGAPIGAVSLDNPPPLYDASESEWARESE